MGRVRFFLRFIIIISYRGLFSNINAVVEELGTAGVFRFSESTLVRDLDVSPNDLCTASSEKKTKFNENVICI